jgi:hypothetical protein
MNSIWMWWAVARSGAGQPDDTSMSHFGFQCFVEDVAAREHRKQRKLQFAGRLYVNIDRP